MKILKIELQNINSLKSDTPIVIDFESEHFKDVGLYAITGSTGAGKTTILDAITIALYHSVPRFNNSKGTLLDVVSHSATDAFSRVTFKNENVIYEAFWGIRLVSSTGKILKNPQEEVRLKNLLTGVTLAELKRNVIEEVIKATQLDYNQFLRSVMLAQGEFASFLSAKGPDKGKLLEQITGEEIYKKIGQGVLDRKSFEENKLKEIQSKINADDVLTEDKKIELSQKNNILDAEITKTEEDIKSIQSIVNWYKNFQELNNASEKLEQDAKEIDIFIEKHKVELDLLDLNEKAEPFKELIQNLNRTEKDTSDKSSQLKTLENQLSELKPQIESLTELTKNQVNQLAIVDKDFNEWLPKFDIITKLDGQLKNEDENKQKSKQNLDELNQQIELLKVEKNKLTTNLTDTTLKIKNDEAFITQNNYLKKVDLELSNWVSELTALKGNKEILKENTEFILQKNSAIEKTTTDLKKNNKFLSEKLVEIEKIENEISSVTKQLLNNNLADLLANKEKLSLTELNWKQFKNLSEQTLKAAKNESDLLLKQKSFSTDLEVIKKQIEVLKIQIETQDKSVADADKILNLEKSISKYEDDRQNLIKGKPCGLCGSTEHPFTEKLESIGVSKSELELHNRKEKLKFLIDSKTILDKNEVKLSTSLDNLTEQIKSITEELKLFKSKANQLNINCKLTNLSKIEIELNIVTEQLKLLDKSLKVTQQLQTDKNDLSERIKIQNESVNTLKNNIATLNENIKNSKTEIENKQLSTKNLTKICSNLESELTTKLSKFNYKLPAVEHTKIFIQEIEELITNFNKKQQNLDALKATITVINTNIENTKNQLEKHSKTQSNYIKIIRECETKTEKLKLERFGILPMNLTVESKRETFQLLIKQLTKKVESSKTALQKVVDSKTEKEALKVKTSNEQKDLTNEINNLKLELNSQIKNSGFESKQDIEVALLSKEDKLKYTQNKERIKVNQLKLKTLKELNAKAKETLNTTKNFEISEAESSLILKEINTKKDEFLTEKGEIIQAFKKDQEIRNRNQEIYTKIDAQSAVCGIWKELFKIIGNSKDAFNVYVQRLTLKHLLDLANVHLYNLNKRYSLKMEDNYGPKEELNFNLIDHYQTDQARLVDTSSGGEKFIISLALALGLSDLASKNVKIDSLFIDEGFGTLDKNTLETVISTLETLQSQGKMIGIISHVENLKERIPTQIQITKKSNGVSAVAIL